MMMMIMMMRSVLLLLPVVLMLLTAATPCMSAALIKEGVTSMLRPAVEGVASDTRRRGAHEAAGHKIIIGAAGHFGREGGLGREAGREGGREERGGGGRHLRAGQREGGGSAGYLGLSARCFTAEDCAPGLFTVSKARRK